AAAGWHATAASLAVQERRNLLYASDTRNGTPFFPEAGGHRFRTLEIPTTLSTLDETLGAPDRRDPDRIVESYVRAIRGTEVHTIHTEVEGTAYVDLFRHQLEAWRAAGVEFVCMEDVARETLAHSERVPVRRLMRVEVPNRGGLVTTGR